MSSSELKPRGPNHAIKRHSFDLRRIVESAAKKAITRMSATEIARSSTGQLKTVKPVQMSELPKSTNANSSAISAVVSPYSRKQSQRSRSSAAIVSPAVNAALDLDL